MRVTGGGLASEVIVPNVDGKRASFAIFAHLAAAHDGQLGPAAAAEGLRLYGEFVAEARAQPGSHPNIDLLLQVVENGVALRVQPAL